MSQVATPLVSPHDAGPGPGPDDAPPHVPPHAVFAHVESAVIFAVPAGCALSHAASHAESLQVWAQSMSAVQSASPRQAFASPQQFVSRQLSHAAAPVPKPHALLGGPEEPPPHAVAQLVPTHVESESSSAAPVGCAVMQPERHASSRHASPHVTSAVQSASETHAVFGAQQLVSRHVSQVASPVESPHDAPPPPPLRVFRARRDGAAPTFAESAAIAAALAPGRERVSFDRQPLSAGFSTGFEDAGSVLSASVVLVSVIVQARLIVDVMAITPKIFAFIRPPRGRTSVPAATWGAARDVDCSAQASTSRFRAHLDARDGPYVRKFLHREGRRSEATQSFVQSIPHETSIALSSSELPMVIERLFSFALPERKLVGIWKM